MIGWNVLKKCSFMIDSCYDYLPISVILLLLNEFIMLNRSKIEGRKEKSLKTPIIPFFSAANHLPPISSFPLLTTPIQLVK